MLSWVRRRVYKDCDHDALVQMLDLSIKAGRRVVHDLDHCISDLGMACYMLEREGIRPLKTADVYRNRSNMWRSIFYPLKGMKNYRSEMLAEQMRLEDEIRRLKKLCADNGIDPEDPEAIPF